MTREVIARLSGFCLPETKYILVELSRFFEIFDFESQVHEASHCRLRICGWFATRVLRIGGLTYRRALLLPAWYTRRVVLFLQFLPQHSNKSRHAPARGAKSRQYSLNKSTGW